MSESTEVKPEVAEQPAPASETPEIVEQKEEVAEEIKSEEPRKEEKAEPVEAEKQEHKETTEDSKPEEKDTPEASKVEESKSEESDTEKTKPDSVEKSVEKSQDEPLKEESEAPKTEVAENSAESKEAAASSESVAEGNEPENEEPVQDEEGEAEAPDDDEDAKNPAYIPRKGAFYMHDSRQDEEAAAEAEQQRKSRADKKWSHDLFNDRHQRPKTKAEIVKKYGFDIRKPDGEEAEEEEETPQPKEARQNRRPPPQQQPRRGGAPRVNETREPVRRQEDDRSIRRQPQRPMRGGGVTQSPSSNARPNSYQQQPQRSGDGGNPTHFKRTIVSSNFKRPGPEKQGSFDNNHNNRGGPRRQVFNRDSGPAAATNGNSRPQRQQPASPPKYQSPRSKNIQHPPLIPPQGIPMGSMGPMPLMAAPPPGAPFIPGPPIAVVPMPVVTTAPLVAGPGFVHPRQPTDVVYFDPNSQASATRTPPQPRERRRLEIVPPTQ